MATHSFKSVYKLHIMILILVISIKLVTPKCNFTDPPAVRRIHFTEITGVWFANTVLRPPEFPDLSRLTWKDYTLDIRSNGQAVIYGRLRASIGTCNYQPSILNRLNSNKNSYLTKFSFTNSTVEIRFTDLYKNRYLVFWGCILDDQGECVKAFIDIFSRRPTAIPDSDLRKLKKNVEKTFCVDVFEDFFNNVFEDRVCPKVEVIQDNQFGTDNWFNIAVLIETNDRKEKQGN